MKPKSILILLLLSIVVACVTPAVQAENIRIENIKFEGSNPITTDKIGMIYLTIQNTASIKQTFSYQVSWAFLNGNYGSLKKESITLDPYRLTELQIPLYKKDMMMPYDWKDKLTTVGYSVVVKDVSENTITKKIINADINAKKETVTEIVSVKPGTTITPKPTPTPAPTPQKPATTYQSGNGLQVNYVDVDPYIIKKNDDFVVRTYFTNYHGQVDAAGQYYPAFFNFQVCYETTNVVNGITLKSKQCLPMSNPGAYTWNGNGDQYCSWNGVQGRDLHLECDNRYQIDPNGVMTIDTGMNWQNLNVQMIPDPSIMQGAWKKVKFTVTAYKQLNCGLPTCTKSADWITKNYGEAWVQIDGAKKI